jgi:uncharacterized C2H2 Zn-finger protein
MCKKTEFYIIRKSYTDYARPVELENTEEIWECPKCGGIFVKRLSDLRVYFKGKKFADYYSVSNYNIVSPKLQSILIVNGITGFRLKNIDIEGWYDRIGNSVKINYDGLKEIDVIGTCGYLRHKDGRIVEKCNECGTINYKKEHEVNGLSVNPDEWDKSDMFHFKNWDGVIIITENVKNILEKNKLEDVNFLNIKDFKFT